MGHGGASEADLGVVPAGHAHGDLEPLREELAATLAGDAGGGAALAVVVDGEVRAHLWGGEAGAGVPWGADTLCPLLSATKVLAALAVLGLHDRGVLDVDEPVAPGTTGGPSIAQALAHRSGHPALAERATIEEALDPLAMGERLLAQAPAWAPGVAHGYHALTFGWPLEVAVRARTGRSLGAHVAELVARGREARIGTPVELHGRVATMVRSSVPPAALGEPEPRLAEAVARPGSLAQRALTWPPLLVRPEAICRADVLAAEWGAVNGTATAVDLARVAGELAAGALLGGATLARLARPAADGHDRVLLRRSRFGLGVMLPGPLFPVPSATALGHTGASGAIVVADPGHGLGIAYLTRAAGPGTGPDGRARRLVAATYRCLGLAPGGSAGGAGDRAPGGSTDAGPAPGSTR